jgi:hypothetical protein
MQSSIFTVLPKQGFEGFDNRIQASVLYGFNDFSFWGRPEMATENTLAPWSSKYLAVE